MEKSVYSVQCPDGTVFNGTVGEISRKTGLSVSQIRYAISKSSGYKGYDIIHERDGRKLCGETYTICRGRQRYSSLTASDVSKKLNIRSGSVAEYAKSGGRFNGWSIIREPFGRKLRFQPAAGYRCFECALHEFDQLCEVNQCSNPKGFYVFD